MHDESPQTRKQHENPKTHNELMTVLPRESKLKLKTSQRSWLKFRDEYYLYLDELYSHLHKDWLTSNINRKIDIVKNRAMDLDATIGVLKDIKEYGD
jgi:hypothetical protein